MAKILVVDDRAPNRDLLVSLLRHLNHIPLEAADGLEALAIASREHPDLVISDILMPTMDGYEFVRRLRADPSIAGTRVIFCTAHYRAREAQSLADACGVHHVLSKPFEPGDLVRVLDEALMAPEAGAKRMPVEFSAEHIRVMTDKLAEKTGELRAARQKLADLQELHLRFAATEDADHLLDVSCRGARELLGARYAVLGVKARTGSGEAAIFTAGLAPALARQSGGAGIGGGELGQVFAERRARRFPGPLATPEALGLPQGLPAAKFAIAAPVVAIAEAYGWLCLLDKAGADAFDHEDELVLASLGAQTGRMYERRLQHARLLAELEVLRADTERRRNEVLAGAELAARLNFRERELVRLVVGGHTTAEVANALKLSPRTVETYRARLMHKLGIKDAASLVKFALRSGIVQLD